MPIAPQFTSDAAKRIVDATRAVENADLTTTTPAYGLQGRLGSERWIWAQINGTPDGNGLYSWKLQYIPANGIPADDPSSYTETHTALEVNLASVPDGSYQRLQFVGKQTDDSKPQWIFCAGGGGGVIRITLSSVLSGASTVTVSIADGGGGTLSVHNRMGLSGSSGAIGYVAMVGDGLDLIQLQCS